MGNYGQKTNCCGRKWCVRDACGLVCAVLTWFLMFYGEFSVLTVMLGSVTEYPIHQTLNFILFQFLLVLAFASHVKTMLTDPGAVPRGNATEDYIMRIQMEHRPGDLITKCSKCECVKPDRAHHCSVCERCIRRMDHHCPWVNNCVGEGNQKYFVLFTFYIALLSIHAVYWAIWQFMLCVSDDWRMCPAFSPPVTTIVLVFLIFEGVLFSIFTMVMFGTQITSICSDQTGIESLKREREDMNTDKWKNIQVVFGGPFSYRWFRGIDEMHSLSQGDGSVPPLVSKLLAKSKPLTVLMIVATVAYLHQTTSTDVISLHMKISENALLAGIVTEKYSDVNKLKAYQRELHARRNGDIYGYIENELTKHGVEVYKQNYSTTLNQYASFAGSTVYGIVPSYRSASVEAIIVAVKVDPDAYESVAVALALASHCREQTYWARNLIFLFVDHEAGMEAWLSAYHGMKHSYMEFRSIEKHAGAIVGGIVLDFRGFSKKSQMNINFNMMNGRLPNLDLLNVVRRLGGKFDFVSTIYNRTNAEDPTETAAIGVASQAFDELQGIHSVFGDYGIQIVGVETRGPRNGHDHSYNLLRLTQFTEGTLRALNNILEKLHQSYFMYVLLNTEQFLSIAYFMIPIALMFVPLLLFAVQGWLSMTVFAVPSVFLVAHVVGLGVTVAAAPLFSRIYSSEMLSYCAVALLAPYALLFKSSDDERKTLKFLIHLEGALVGSSLSLLNFGLGFIISAAIVIANVAGNFITKKPISYLKSAMLLGMHPLGLLIYFNRLDHIVYTYMMHNSTLLPIICAFLIPYWNLLIYSDLKSPNNC